MMNKIEIKLKECCLTCEHFDMSGIKWFGAYIASCGEPERVIACGHMDVCKKYIEYNRQKKEKKAWGRAYLPDFGMTTIYICPECGFKCVKKIERCPGCGVRLYDDEEKA